MNSDTLTTIVGIGVGVLHQLGIVGTVPTTRTEWLSTGVSLGFGVLGYYTNKKLGVSKKV